MIELQLVWAWARARMAMVRDNGDGGFGVLEWVALAAIVVVAAIAIGTYLMNEAKKAAHNVHVQ